jgi:hypothetical protein
MELGVDFRFKENYKEKKADKTDTVPIELLTGPFKGVTYRYLKVAIQELENGTAKLQFEYDILDAGPFTEVKLRKLEKFSHIIGLILNTLILEIVDTPHGRVDANREGNSEEPTAE